MLMKHTAPRRLYRLEPEHIIELVSKADKIETEILKIKIKLMNGQVERFEDKRNFSLRYSADYIKDMLVSVFLLYKYFDYIPTSYLDQFFYEINMIKTNCKDEAMQVECYLQVAVVADAIAAKTDDVKIREKCSALIDDMLNELDQLGAIHQEENNRNKIMYDLYIRVSENFRPEIKKYYQQHAKRYIDSQNVYGSGSWSIATLLTHSWRHFITSCFGSDTAREPLLPPEQNHKYD